MLRENVSRWTRFRVLFHRYVRETVDRDFACFRDEPNSLNGCSIFGLESSGPRIGSRSRWPGGRGGGFVVWKTPRVNADEGVYVFFIFIVGRWRSPLWKPYGLRPVKGTAVRDDTVETHYLIIDDDRTRVTCDLRYCWIFYNAHSRTASINIVE